MIWRETVLQPIVTIQLFFLQILHGNTACEHLRHLAQMTFTGAAYCTARMRIPLSVFQTLLARTAAPMKEEVSDTGRWLGHRLFYVDGSSFSMPDERCLQKEFGQPGGQKEGCGLPPLWSRQTGRTSRQPVFAGYGFWRGQSGGKPPHSKIARGPRQLAARARRCCAPILRWQSWDCNRQASDYRQCQILVPALGSIAPAISDRHSLEPPRRRHGQQAARGTRARRNARVHLSRFLVRPNEKDYLAE